MQPDIKHRFEAARLPLVVSPTPIIHAITRGADSIFQMDIQRNKKTNQECFRIYCGAPDNDVLVTGVDNDLRQVVLHVSEPRHQFTERQWDARRHKYVSVVRTTNTFARAYLMGHDETALFIAELPARVTNVTQAHECLKPAAVKTRQRTSKVKRQGEWFFLPVTAEEERQIADLLHLQPIEHKVQIGHSHNPHIAEFRLGDFVKGHINHPQHHSLKLVGWRRFVRNTEAEQTARRDPRIGWID